MPARKPGSWCCGQPKPCQVLRLDRAFAADARKGNGLVRTDLDTVSLTYKLNQWVSFVNETSYIVTRVDYALRKDGPARIAYADLKKQFAGVSEPSLAEVSSAVRSIRHQKGMLIVDGDPDMGWRGEVVITK